MTCTWGRVLSIWGRNDAGPSHCAGAKKREEIYEAFEAIYPVLQEFRKADSAADAAAAQPGPSQAPPPRALPVRPLQPRHHIAPCIAPCCMRVRGLAQAHLGVDFGSSTCRTQRMGGVPVVLDLSRSVMSCCACAQAAPGAVAQLGQPQPQLQLQLGRPA
jgi:hypothetical protein